MLITPIRPIVLVAKSVKIILHKELSVDVIIETYSTLGFLYIALEEFKAARRWLQNLSIKLMNLETLKSKLCVGVFHVKECIDPWLHDIRDFIPDLKANFSAA